MTADKNIRCATLDDLETIVEFNLALALETEGLRLLRDQLADGVRGVLSDARRGFYLVSQLASTIIGAMMVTYEWSDWRNGNFWWVQSVYVRPPHRQQGVFRSLYRHAHDLAQSDPTVCGFRLYMEKSNHTAQQTYTSLGLKQTPYVVFEELKATVRYHS